MNDGRLKPGAVVRGSLFPEPVQVIICTPLGPSVKLVGKGLDSGGSTNRSSMPPRWPRCT